ncbi:MAG: 3-hydroxyanthranilate 3,4-dioxygenase [Candidatus Obscuribacterales bacterium]|nr:3-hydroxyanthranilate 3,4-dioxygenase [Candidatus Obscuribacterales bacterium]
MFTTINLKNWINENRHLLKPPVGNKCVWENREFIVMIVGGPNTRTDYHVNLSEEFFYQLEGDIVLKVIDNGKPMDISIKEGEIFLLPANTPHSPRRPANTVGLVIERQRRETEIDALQWYCESCGEKLYEEKFNLTDITGQFQPIFERFFNSDASTCKKCGTKAKQ